MNAEFLETLLLTIRLAGITTVLLLIIGIPLGYWLAFTRSWIKPIVEALTAIPLVLPPTVLGFYLLVFLGPSGYIGSLMESLLGMRLVFTFEGLVVGSVIFSLPFMVHPVQSGLENLPDHLREASYTLGASPFRTLFRVLLPNIKPSLLTGIILSFSHTVGEFGVVLMIGGNLAGETKTASIAIYNEVESLNYGLAHLYAFILFIISFLILLSVYVINRRYSRRGFL